MKMRSSYFSIFTPNALRLSTKESLALSNFYSAFVEFTAKKFLMRAPLTASDIIVQHQLATCRAKLLKDSLEKKKVALYWHLARTTDVSPWMEVAPSANC